MMFIIRSLPNHTLIMYRVPLRKITKIASTYLKYDKWL